MKALCLLCSLCFPVILTVALQHTYTFNAAKQPYYRNATLGFGYMNVLYHPKSKLEVPEGNMLQVATLNYSECLIECARNLSCFSINFRRNPIFIYQGEVQYLCQLLPTDKYNFSSNYQINNQEFDHYSIKSECNNSPCLHNSPCIPNYVKDTYECLCPRPSFQDKHCKDLSCDFEVDMCEWTPYPQNGFGWRRRKGHTISTLTGPTGDATTSKNGLGYYIYTEASYGTTGNKAELRSPVFAPTSGRCLEFAYHMYGFTMGTFKVYIVNAATETKSLIFSKSGNQGQKWYRVKNVIASASDYKIVFEVTRGSSFYSDAALDDIFINEGVCT